MATNAEIADKILGLQNLLLSKRRYNGQAKIVKSIERFLSLIKGVGIIENLPINGSKDKYLIIEGDSWKKAHDELNIGDNPDFVIMEECHFFTLLQNKLNNGHNRK